ncbi:acyl-CoA synthetase (AMP-forming)/AMP-acid ligase II [Kibdelosporangium banguiense]|uniref:Acyl-CoA synthetase (AMP-forming)/AMP-acid ligase II n=1 Tax=Kibdelosporangium banguiense TaxID=1365924 RepID=A0ABS4TPZ9_9PSEU|nr:class I adenylate-forming enzyme family protein [Kibdelosporangium banguiense]MBP2326064.1 acyl-CoA synthetase (AMP-forming)/AMP-acid ligase II [Kibdelosporangium banguiense]
MRQAVLDFQKRAEQADFVAVIDDSGEHTARDLLARAAELAVLLGDGRTVLAQAANSWRTFVIALAAGRTGSVLAVINKHATKGEFDDALDDIRPDVVVAEPSLVDEWSVSGPGTPVLEGWSSVSIQDAADLDRWDGGVFIGLTSGSTGRAKGVVQSEEALHYACSCTIEINGLSPGDTIAAIVPLSSTAAFCFGVYCSLVLGGPLVLTAKWDPATVLARLAETNTRWTMCVPTMALQMAAVEPPVPNGIRSITVGGGPMDRTALARAEQALGTKILRVFGMSECLGHTSPRPAEPEDIRLGRDGRPFPGTEVRAVSSDGVVLGPGETGRAQVRGPSLFRGYARNGRVQSPDLTPDGFFSTGDLLLADDDGTITIMGREKDVIIRGGRNIDITEIERAVAGYERLNHACVVPIRDDVLGERIALLAVARDSRRLALEEITSYLASLGLAKTKWPEFVYTVDRLPQTTVGKLDRKAARELAGKLHSDES